jgi:SNF2 family DNA or RNA helicase
MNVNDLYVIDNNIVDTQASCSTDEEQEDELDPTKPNKKNDKYQNLEVILKNAKPDAKLLLFSAYDNTFYNVVPILRNLQISFEYLKGNGNQINCCLERYKNGTTKVLLVNSRAFGSGLNLENTSDIIMFHKFDTEIEKQVIGRAHRLGRSEPLNVYYLLYENEMSLSN